MGYDIPVHYKYPGLARTCYLPDKRPKREELVYYDIKSSLIHIKIKEMQIIINMCVVIKVSL